MFTLKNENIEFSLDTQGKLVHLLNRQTGRDYAGGTPLWRIICSYGRCQEEEIPAENSIAEVQQPTKDTLKLQIVNPRSKSGETKFRITITIHLEEERLCMEAHLANHSASGGPVLREFQFPLIGNLQLRPDTGLIWGGQSGQFFPRLKEAVAACHTAYMAQDNRAVELSTLYPGASANCHLVHDQEQNLYVGSHDPTFQYTLHLFRKRGEEIDDVLVKYPFLAPGEETSVSGYVLAPVTGSWHQTTHIYRDWCNCWMRRPELPESVRKSNGRQRLILRHQYGETFYQYRDFPHIRQVGKEAGIDTLLLFGWTQTGHDAGYPDYYADAQQGGQEELKRRIAAFQESGGKVILYFNGQLIDLESDFYRSGGSQCTIKLPSGAEYRERYPFGGDGTALRRFGNKTFAVACPSSPEWRRKLLSMADLAIELGCSGIFFDQMGLSTCPCCDPTHGHRVPFTTIMKAKADLLEELRAYIKSRRPDMSLGIEWDNDLTAQHVDFIHNVSGLADVVNKNWAERGEKPFGTGFFEFTRYLFPEHAVSDRDIRDDQDIERRVNHAVHLGLRSDVEIYRCRDLISATPHYKAYLARINEFRDRNRDLLLNGYFRHDEGVYCDNRELQVSVFRNGTLFGVLISQNHLPITVATLRIPHGVYLAGDAADPVDWKVSSSSPDAITVTVPRNTLILLRFAVQEA